MLQPGVWQLVSPAVSNIQASSSLTISNFIRQLSYNFHKHPALHWPLFAPVPPDPFSVPNRVLTTFERVLCEKRPDAGSQLGSHQTRDLQSPFIEEATSGRSKIVPLLLRIRSSVKTMELVSTAGISVKPVISPRSVNPRFGSLRVLATRGTGPSRSGPNLRTQGFLLPHLLPPPPLPPHNGNPALWTVLSQGHITESAWIPLKR